MVPPSVVVHHLDLLHFAVLPHEADPILVVDPDAALPPSIAGKCLKVISRKRSQVVESVGCVKVGELALCDPGNAPKPAVAYPWNSASASRFRKDRITCSYYGAMILQALRQRAQSREPS
jgi:hypothetical protein